MNIWNILGISPTDNVDIIKKAYRNKLKSTRPDDDEKAFMQLRDAYEQALEYSETQHKNEDEENYEEYEEYEDYEDVSPEYKIFMEWMQKVNALYEDYTRRNQVSEWKELLFSDIPYQLEYYKLCRRYIIELVFLEYESVYLPQEVRLLLNDFFTLSKKPLERAKTEKNNERAFLNKLNLKFKQCENIKFNKLNPHGMAGGYINNFFYRFDMLMHTLAYEDELKTRVDELIRQQLFYLPLECLHIYVHFDEFSFEENLRKIEELERNTDVELPDDDKIELEILKAGLLAYSGNVMSARMLLKELYIKVSAKDYYSLYMLALCCKSVEMYYEAYMLVKQLTWLSPQDFMYEMAEDICKRFEDNYQNIEADDLAHIRMCRMYLRSNREAEAVKVLKRVKDVTRYQWEYEVAHAMCIFYEDSISVPSNLYVLGLTKDAEEPMEVVKAKPVFEILEGFPKDELSNIDRLEWQELQGRYLFEQRLYNECEEFCNELLEEYPVSYPILTLRGYADFNAHTFGENDRFTEYTDCTFLMNVMPQRSEIRLLLAQLFSFSKLHDEALKIMEPLREVFPDRFRWYEMFVKYTEMDRLLAIKDIFAEAKNRELDIPPVSKYRLLDLRNMFTYACDYVWTGFVDEEVNKIYQFFLTLKESRFNNPQLYMEEGYLYRALGMTDEAAAVELSKLKNASKREQQRLYNRLVGIYMDDYEKLKEYVKYVNEEIGCRAMGYAAGTVREYEVSVANMERAVAYNSGVINQYQRLGKSYKGLGKHEEAIKAHEMGIRKIDITGNSVTGQTNSYVEIACGYFDLKRYEECLKYLELGKKYIRNQEALARYYFLLGLCYYCMDKDGEYETQKIEAWSQSAKLHYERVTLYTDLANVYVDKGEPEKAIEVLNIGLEVTGSSGDYTYNSNNIGNLYYKIYVIYCDEIRDYDKAIEYLELMKNNTEYEYYQKDYYFRIGFVYFLMDDRERMKTAWLKAAEMNLTYTLIYGELSEVYEEKGDDDSQMLILKKGIENIDGCTDYGNCNLYIRLYFIYMNQGEYLEAYNAALQLLSHTELDKMKLDGLEAAGTAALILEKFEEAYELYQKKITILSDRGEKVAESLIMNCFIAAYALRRSEAKELALSLVHNEAEADSVNMYTVALRADYMAKGYVDRNFAEYVNNELTARIGKNEPDDIYMALVEVNAALGNNKQVKAYTEELFKYIDSWDNYYATLAWCHIYRGDFHKAFELYDAKEENKALLNSPNGYAEYNFIKDTMEDK